MVREDRPRECCDGTAPRARLHPRLGRPVRLVVIRAPRGYAKTDLLASWLGCCCCTADSVEWIPRPRPDTTAGEYWAAVQEVAGCADGTAPERRSGTRVIVLDRVDLLDDPDVERMVLGLLDRCTHLKVVVTSCRSTFLEDVAALCASHDLLGPHDLEFTLDEAAQELRSEQVNLEPGELEHLHRQVRGVPTLARVVIGAARGLARGANRAARLDRTVTRVLTRFVRDRVLNDGVPSGLNDGVPAEVGAGTLLRLAPARVLTEDVVTFLTGSVDPAALLDRLDTLGVIGQRSGSAEREWEFLPVVRRVLLGIARDSGMDTTADLVALARFHIGRGEPVTALPLAVDGAEWELAAGLIEENWVAMISDELGELRNALEVLPDDVLENRPSVRLGRDMFAYSGGALPDVVTLPDDPQELAELGRSSKGEEALAVAAVRSMLLRVSGEIGAAAALTRPLVHLMTAAAATWPQRVLPQVALMRLQGAITYQLAGDLDDSTADLQLVYPDAVGRGFEFIARNAAGSMALNWALVGECGRAQEWLDVEAQHVEPVGNWLESRVRIAGLAARAIVAMDRLDLDMAGRVLGELDTIDETEELWGFVAHAYGRHALLTADATTGLIRLRRSITRHRNLFRSGVALPLLAGTEAMLRLAVGEGNHALALADTASSAGPWTVPVAAQAHLLTGDATAALKLARSVDWISRHHPRAHLSCRLVEAVACLDLGDTAAAANAWREARQVSRQTGLRSPFASVPRAARDILDEIDATGGDEGVHPGPGDSVFPSLVHVVRLTEREQVVLEQFAQGHTVQRSADNLFVSINTVKSQQRSLYRKLGVHSRDEVIVTARRLGLLR